jgi:hypothetical protein
VTLWVDHTCLDVVATAQAAQIVMMRPLNEYEKVSATNPLVPKLMDDNALREFANFILTKDVVARLDAFSAWDFTGDCFRAIGREPQRARGNDGGVVHEAFECLRDPGYDVDANLRDAIDGRVSMLPQSAMRVSVHGATDVSLRGVHATMPEMRRTPSGNYSPAPAQQSAALLNQLRLIRQAASEALDMGLATAGAANWAAARAAALSWATTWYPERGYT